MAGGGGGLSRYHWIGLLVPLLALASMALWSRVAPASLPRPAVALGAGAAVTCLAYLVFRFVPGLKETSAFGKALVLGAIVVEILTFHSFAHIPPASTLALALFLYCHAAEAADTA